MEYNSAALKKTWHSPVYMFFSPNVSIQYHNDRLCHFFPCGSRKCKTKLGGVCRYQDTKDKSSTTNLKHHAIGCFGEDAVNNALKGKDAGANSGSIFVAFARQGQQPVNYTHRVHTNRELHELLCAGRPNIHLPSPDTLSHDIKTAFEICGQRVGKLLRCLHFVTDAWTSPNHQAFVAWTVHLEHEGKMFSFLLDIVEVAKVHC
ncbi:hypothetical protein PAXINDRAFT_89791 [Paxillus involutus ATCC 200175]|uniref:Uncharacterized protein n=1 Tax=Paxillus involutus ATCC 200175 TaxID=664439 RepID=A0A0C9TIL8_PAXIN|nr:hypothetical protein PAXINDRAFT_89791 [Paxillus involutus ATCC 200175]